MSAAAPRTDSPSPQTTSSSAPSSPKHPDNVLDGTLQRHQALVAGDAVPLPSPFVLQPVLAEPPPMSTSPNALVLGVYGGRESGPGPPSPLHLASYSMHPLVAGEEALPPRPTSPAASTSHLHRVPSVVFDNSTAASDQGTTPRPYEDTSPDTTAASRPPATRHGTSRRSRKVLSYASPNWKRSHAWHWPWDPYLVLNYLITLLLLGTFPLMARILPDAVSVYLAQVLPFCLLLVIATVLGIFVGVRETEATEVRSARVPRDSNFVMRRGERVIDRRTGRCGVCRVQVDATTRHCKRCNKCIHAHDHHCRWLNTCVAGANRVAFNLMLAAMMLAGAVYLAVATRVLIYLFSFGPLEVGKLAAALSVQFPGLPASSSSVNGMRVAVVLLALIGVICYSGVVQLSVLHARLYWRGMTTTEYLRERRRERREAAARNRKDEALANLDAQLSSAASDVTHVQQAGGGEKLVLPVKPTYAAPNSGAISRGAASRDPAMPTVRISDAQPTNPSGTTNVVNYMSDDGASHGGQVIFLQVHPATEPTEAEESDVLWGSVSDTESERNGAV